MNFHTVRNNNNNKKKNTKALKYKSINKRIKMSGTTLIPSNPTLIITSPFLTNPWRRTRKIYWPCFDVTDNKTATDLHDKQTSLTMNDHFHREDERLKTFKNWPLDWLDKRQLAQTGMFFTGDGDKVKCYFCEVEIGRWEHQDQPVSEHLRWSANCPLLRRRTTNNVPINPEELNHILPPISHDVCGTHDSFEMRQNVYAEFPEYAIEASRERSFTNWPSHMKQTPTQMAEAGFFHSGSGDRVKCFSCGGGLKDWDATDDPWEQHALWLPKCRFLKLMKGQNFIDAVAAKNKAMPTSDDESEKPTCSTQVPTTPIAASLSETETTISNQTTCAEQEAPSTTSTATTSAAIMCDTITPCSIESDKRAPPTSSNIPEEKLCKICYTNEYNTAFLPCGHVVACAKCASSVTKCPMCRKHFTDIMRVYFS